VLSVRLVRRVVRRQFAFVKKATLITLAALVVLAALLLLVTSGNTTATTWQILEERLPAAVQSAGFRTIASQSESSDRVSLPLGWRVRQLLRPEPRPTLVTGFPDSVQHYMRLAAIEIRREVCDLVRHERGVNRSRARVVEAPADSPSGGDFFDQKAEETDDGPLTREELHECTQKLHEKEREICDLIFYQGLTYKDAAHLLGVSESTVKRRWYDAKETLHRLMVGQE